MNTKAQLGVIEFKFFMSGLLVGLFGTFITILLGTQKVLPFTVPAVCGSLFLNKKGQLGPIEFKFFMIGLFVGVVAALLLTALGSRGVLPIEVPLVCG